MIESWLLTPTPEYQGHLYHYTSAVKARSIVRASQFRFGLVSKLNDPRETHEHLVDVVTAANDANYQGVDPANVEELRSQLEEFFRRHTRVGCFTLDRDPISTNAPPRYVGNYHLGWARARMWAQYAERHEGVCLVFNRRLFSSQVDATFPHGEWDLISSQVTYLDEPFAALFDATLINPVSFAGIMRTMRSWGQTSQVLYFVKNRDWESENEYRFVLFPGKKDANDIREPVAVSTMGSLEAVVLGEAFNDSSIGDMQVVASDQGAALLKCSWFRGAPQLTEVVRGVNS